MGWPKGWLFIWGRLYLNIVEESVLIGMLPAQDLCSVGLQHKTMERNFSPTRLRKSIHSALLHKASCGFRSLRAQRSWFWDHLDWLTSQRVAFNARSAQIWVGESLLRQNTSGSDGSSSFWASWRSSFPGSGHTALEIVVGAQTWNKPVISMLGGWLGDQTSRVCSEVKETYPT